MWYLFEIIMAVLILGSIVIGLAEYMLGTKYRRGSDAAAREKHRHDKLDFWTRRYEEEYKRIEDIKREWYEANMPYESRLGGIYTQYLEDIQKEIERWER